MFATLAAILSILFGVTGGSAITAAADTAAADTAAVSNVSWPAVDNRYAAFAQCAYYLESGEDRDDCFNSAREAFPAIAPCATEDAAGPCYWNAAARGNGTGESFTVDAAGAVTYLSAALRQ